VNLLLAFVAAGIGILAAFLVIKTRARKFMVVWALIIMPAIIFGYVIWAIVILPLRYNPWTGFYAILLGALFSGTGTLYWAYRGNSPLVMAVVYLLLGGPILLIVSAFPLGFRAG